jgi:hypothetical protein
LDTLGDGGSSSADPRKKSLCNGDEGQAVYDMENNVGTAAQTVKQVSSEKERAQKVAKDAMAVVQRNRIMKK